VSLSEKAFQDQVIELATWCRWRHFHVFDSRRSDAGWPDLVLVRAPQLLVAELKTDRGRLTPAQRDWLAVLAACGVETHVWRPRDFDEIHARLTQVAFSR
jgi:hypothetical protein